MKNSHQMNLESELSRLIKRYMNSLTAGEIAESLIGLMTCCCYVIGKRSLEPEKVEDDLICIIQENIKNCKSLDEDSIS